MKTATIAFLLLLVAAHTGGNLDELLAQPMSVLRDGDQAAIGYALFALLAVIAGFMTAASIRARRELEAGVFCLAGCLLMVVAVTPSLELFHGLCSFVLLGLMYGYFGCLLRGSESVWLYAHLPVPVALLCITGFHSYGLWQKSLTVYLLILINIRAFLLSRCRPEPMRSREVTRHCKRRVVYVVESGKSWARRPLRRAESSTI
jgi:hypothetical protein